MTFPTIPTAAASRILSVNQANTTATRTFPNLSLLTAPAGDLIVAIVFAYQTSTGTDAAFSGWTGGFTEFHDSATSTTMAIGCAYKWSTGSEAGTFAVTQAGTITGHASMIVMSIAGAHASTPPEAGGRASGVNSTAQPGALNPTGWDAEDTLWITCGCSGETSTTGSFTGMAASDPTNYTDNFVTGITADVVGGVEGKVAFRQLNAASETPPTFSNDTSNARWGALTVAVRPAPANYAQTPIDQAAPGDGAALEQARARADSLPLGDARELAVGLARGDALALSDSASTQLSGGGGPTPADALELGDHAVITFPSKWAFSATVKVG